MRSPRPLLQYLTGQLLDALRLRGRLGLVLGALRGDRFQPIGGDLGRQLLVGGGLARVRHGRLGCTPKRAKPRERVRHGNDIGRERKLE